MEKRNLTPLAGALFAVFLIATFAGVWGDTPKGDVSGTEVISYYQDHGTQGMVAAVMLAVSAVPLLVFASAVRERLRASLPEGSMLPSVAFGAGIVGAAGFTAAASAHFAVADYADELEPAAAQAVNAIDADLFLAFTMGLATLVLAMSLAALRSAVLPSWAGRAGVVLFVGSVTPAGVVAFPLCVLWILMTSVMLYRRGPGLPRTSSRTSTAPVPRPGSAGSPA